MEYFKIHVSQKRERELYNISFYYLVSYYERNALHVKHKNHTQKASKAK